MPKYEGMAIPEAVSLGPDEFEPDRPFTAVEMRADDLRCLRIMLRDLSRVLDEVDTGDRAIKPYQRLAWRVDGLTHRLLICDEKRLRAHPDLCVVGFFAEKRPGVDFRPLDEANTAIVGEFAKYPGILSYSSVELPDGGWANLVLHDDPVDPDYWRRSQLHSKAVSYLSPIHYKNVRIHNARLTAPVMDRPDVMVKKTKYFDYSGEQEWRAERTLIPD